MTAGFPGKAGNTEDYGKWFYQTIENGNQIVNGREGEKWAEFDLKAMVRRGRNNPSIIMWSLGNEIFQQLTDGNVTGQYPEVGKKTDHLDRRRRCDQICNLW